MLFLSICSIVVSTIFLEMIALYVGKIVIILYQVHWLNFILLKSVYCIFLYSDCCSMYVLGCFYYKFYLCMFFKNKLSYPVHWLILYLLRSVWYFFHINYCSKYVICCFTRSHFFLWLQNDYYIITSSLINSILTSNCTSLFLSLLL